MAIIQQPSDYSLQSYATDIWLGIVKQELGMKESFVFA
jgi:hypothetical protein